MNKDFVELYVNTVFGAIFYEWVLKEVKKK